MVGKEIVWALNLLQVPLQGKAQRIANIAAQELQIFRPIHEETHLMVK